MTLKSVHWVKWFETTFPPAPRLTLESYNGEVIKYWDFIRRFKRHVDKVYPRFEDIMVLLESSCAGKAQEVSAGIDCLFDSPTTFIKAWERLDGKFGNAHGTFAWGTAHGFCHQRRGCRKADEAVR